MLELVAHKEPRPPCSLCITRLPATAVYVTHHDEPLDSLAIESEFLVSIEYRVLDTDEDRVVANT